MSPPFQSNNYFTQKTKSPTIWSVPNHPKRDDAGRNFLKRVWTPAEQSDLVIAKRRKRILTGAGGLTLFAILFPLALEQMNVRYPFIIGFTMFLVALSGLVVFVWQLPVVNTRGRVAKGGIAIIILALAIGFLTPQLKIHYLALIQQRPPAIAMEVYSGDRHNAGSKVHGIPWRSDLMDMWMTISNNSGTDYEDFSMSVESIAMEKQQKDVFLGFYEIAQVSGSVECRTQRAGYFYGFTLAPREGEPLGRPIDGTNLDTTTKKVRADCSRFPSATNLTFVVAVKNVRWIPGDKTKPAAALVELRYKAKGIEFWKSDFVDIRDMGSVKVKRSEDELIRLRSQLSPGKASAITKGPGEKSSLMIMDSESRP